MNRKTRFTQSRKVRKEKQKLLLRVSLHLRVSFFHFSTSSYALGYTLPPASQADLFSGLLAHT